MQNPRLASRYAKSLLDLAIEQNSLDSTLQDVEFLNEVCRKSPEFTAMLRSPVITSDKKLAIIQAVAASKLQPLMSAFITLLVKKGREASLPEIAKAFISQFKQLRNIKVVRLTTAAAVSDSLRDAIRTKVAASMPTQTIELQTAINPDLIGGFVLEMDDKIVDASIRRDLNDIKMQFSKNLYEQNIR